MAKGKIIKHWNDSSVTETGEWCHAKLPISLTAGDGVFHIPLAPHVVEYFGPSISDNSGHGNDWKGYSESDGEVRASTLDGVQGLYKRVLRLYQDRRRNEVRRKVIVVDFHANVPGQSRFSGTKIGEISFASRPALSLSHSILWNINGALYSVYDRGDGEPPQMSYKSKMPQDADKGSRSTFVLDWTPEREAFFDGMRDNMARLIDLIAQMLLGDTSANIDRLIAGGGFLSLPAPSAEVDEVITEQA